MSASQELYREAVAVGGELGTSTSKFCADDQVIVFSSVVGDALTPTLEENWRRMNRSRDRRWIRNLAIYDDRREVWRYVGAMTRSSEKPNWFTERGLVQNMDDAYVGLAAGIFCLSKERQRKGLGALTKIGMGFGVPVKAGENAAEEFFKYLRGRTLREGDASYIVIKAKNVAIIWVNNDFGKGGLDTMKKALDAAGIKVTAEISTDPGQLDFSGAVLKAKQANADALFVYTNEEEAARALRELRKQGYDKPIVGETVLTSQKVIELAGDAANGATAHVGLTADAPQEPIKKYNAAFQKEFGSKSDHNGLKGYSAMYVVKAVTEKIGKFDQKAFAKAMHGMHLSAKEYPGVLLDVTFDDKGDLDRESFMTTVVNGKQVVTSTLPAASAK